MTQSVLVNANSVTYWEWIPPVKRIRLYDDEEWETFIEEWADVRRNEGEYFSVLRLWWANDKGRDIQAMVTEPVDGKYVWDCYQCKHYDKPISPTNIYVELGKIIYFSFIKAYPVPRGYYIMAPLDIWSTLSDYLKNPDLLRSKLIENWQTYCENKIIKNQSIKILSWDKFEGYLEAFDFSIFKTIPVKDVIEKHAAHRNHLNRFGWRLADRPDPGPPSSAIWIHESIYVQKLLTAYGDQEGRIFNIPEELRGQYEAHFSDARKNFHFSEQLKNFYRDSIKPWTYEDFQEEIYQNASLSEWVWFSKVKDAERLAATTQIDSNPLKDVCKIRDKKGACHQLSNENRISWN